MKNSNTTELNAALSTISGVKLENVKALLSTTNNELLVSQGMSTITSIFVSSVNGVQLAFGKTN